jgi:uracil-DNA glycosylase family 4
VSQNPFSPDQIKIIRQNMRMSVLMGVDYVPAFMARPEPPTQASPVASEPAPDRDEHTDERESEDGQGTMEIQVGEVPTYDLSDPRRATAHRELMAIRERYERDAPHKAFVTSFTNIVFGEGDPIARLMFVGEAPGADEDRTGRPFVGRAGQLLDKMIIAMGLRREDVYIANVLKTRPPNNATPTKEEAAACAPYLFDQIAAVNPQVIVTLGLPASRLILCTDESMTSMRGTWRSWSHPDPARAVTIAVMPTYHPAFLLRSYTPENRKKVWSDLKMAMERLNQNPR